jgi:general L-amino acid transport system substrate-binding protein
MQATRTLARIISGVVVLGMLSILGFADGAHAATLDDIKARGHLVCGISDQLPGFAVSDNQGTWSGFEVDFCSAIAAAVFGDRKAVQLRPLSNTDRFTALAQGDVDVLARATTWTLSRDTELGVRFTDVLFYDGQGFLVNRDEAVTSALELSGASICVLSGPQGEEEIAQYFTPRGMRVEPVTSDKWSALVKSYAAGQCAALSADITMLAAERSRFVTPLDHMLLPEVVTKEPFAPAVRQGDDAWFTVVRWTRMALIAAEELGVTSSNVDSVGSSGSAEARRLIGLDANLGQSLGLARDWAYQIIKQVGNYGEIYDRTLGHRSVLRLDRGLNNLWTQGGLLYAAPFR